MPKKVDHRARRTQIADALMRVAATQGLQAVSLRHVATEAGVSTGMVQHYFNTKDEMMAFARGVVADRVRERLADYPAEGSSPEERVRAFLIELLPLDEKRLVESQVALAFHAYAVIKPDIIEGRESSVAAMRDFLADQLREDPAVSDPTQAATILLAIVEGLAMQVVRRQYSPEEVLATFDALLDRTFRGG